MTTSFPIRRGEAKTAIHQIAVPDEARAVCTLARIDCEDAFEVDVGGVQDRTAPGARAMWAWIGPVHVPTASEPASRCSHAASKDSLSLPDVISGGRSNN